MKIASAVALRLAVDKFSLLRSSELRLLPRLLLLSLRGLRLPWPREAILMVPRVLRSPWEMGVVMKKSNCFGQGMLHEGEREQALQSLMTLTVES